MIEGSLTLELIEDFSKLAGNSLIEIVIGMANAEGGTIVLSSPNGLTYRKDLEKIGSWIAHHTVPAVFVRTDLRNEGEREVLQIEIPKSKSIVATVEGKILRRVLQKDGIPRTVPFYPCEMGSRVSELKKIDFSAQIIPNATSDDLDSSERRKLRKLLEKKSSEKFLSMLSDEEFDCSLGLRKKIGSDAYPSITGLLLIGKEESLKKFLPYARVSFQVKEGINIKFKNDFHQPLLSLLDSLKEKFHSYVSQKDVSLGANTLPVPDFSEAVFFEAFLNAFCHRDYQLPFSTRIIFEDEGLTINSPGGFVEGLNAENLLLHFSLSRNPLLAEVCRRIGVVEVGKRGIDTIYAETLIYGRNLPDYSESTSNAVTLFLERAPGDLKFFTWLKNFEIESNSSLSIWGLLVLACLRQGRKTGKKLKECLGIGEQRLEKTLANLINFGLVKEMDSEKEIFQLVLDGILSGSEIQAQKKIEEWILTLAETGPVNRMQVAEACNLSAPQAYRFLKKLEQKGIFRREGKGPATKYFRV